MSFSDDLDAARERAGLPVIRRLKCECGATLVTTSERRAGLFGDRHYGYTLGGVPLSHRVTYLEGPGRFRIKRAKADSAPWPWVVKDAERPAAFGHARTHAAAIELVGAMHARPGQHVQMLDDDDEVVAYVSGAIVAPGVGIVAYVRDPSVTTVLPAGRYTIDFYDEEWG